jgi:hypothetical protein
MTPRHGCIAVALLSGTLLCSTGTAQSAPPGPHDPDWPCQQIKVPQLSLAAVWSGPSIDQPLENWQQDQTVTELVRETAQRRIPIEQAQEKIHTFAAQVGAARQTKLLDLFAGLFRTLDDERSSVVAGLDRFGMRQKVLATELRNDNEKLRMMQADPKSDAGAMNQLIQKVTWEAQVFQDRRQALSYACDVPAKIEQRLFVLARTVQEALQ